MVKATLNGQTLAESDETVFVCASDFCLEGALLRTGGDADVLLYPRAGQTRSHFLRHCVHSEGNH